MRIDILFIFNSILFGIALAMDAFSVAVANALKEQKMAASKRILIAGTFGFFQTAMPMIGWICVHSIEQLFNELQKFIPWIALALLLFLGIKMIIEAVKEDGGEKVAVGFGGLILQGIATSIDALSVGFTISDYRLPEALLESFIIGIVTFAICILGIFLGNRIGSFLKNKAGILGGIILIGIGIEIFLKGIL